MSEQKYKFDAFISYRHGGIDQFVAENLHKKMETFKLPKSIKNKTNGKTKINRVFRDQEELPLTSDLGDPIREALEASEWLIVICSPRLHESKWCQTEIETFISIHGREKVLAVLVEGEPSDSFPEQLLYKTEEVIEENGEKRTIKRTVEPLAADMRGVNNREVKKAMNIEMLRLLAPMFGVTFDDLRQRHRERKLRSNMMIATIITGVAIAFGVVSSTFAIQINSQKNEIAAQNEKLAYNQALSLAEKSNYALSAGRRGEAIDFGLAALTQSDGVDMPYTPEAQCALTDALYVYDEGDRFLPVANLYADSEIVDIFMNSSASYGAAIDMYGKLYVFDLEKGELFDVVTTNRIEDYAPNTICFVDDMRLAVIDTDGTLSIYNIADKQMSTPDFAINKAYERVYSKDCSQYVYFLSADEIILVDKEAFEIAKVIKLVDTSCSYNIADVDDQEKYIALYSDDLEISEQKLDVYSIDGNIVFTEAGETFLKNSRIYGDVLYYLTSEDTDDWVYFSNVIKAVDLKNNESLWESRMDEYGVAITPSMNPESDVMIFMSTNAIAFVDQKDGHIINKMGLDACPAAVYSLDNSANYSLFLENGKLETADAERGAVYTNVYFTSCTEGIKDVMFGKGVIMTVDYSSNEVIVYKHYTAPGVELYDGEVSYPEIAFEGGKEAREKAKVYNENKADLVAYVIESEDTNTALLCYINGKIDVYNYDNRQYVGEIEESHPSPMYYGKDKNGNYYLGDYISGYVYNPQLKLIANIFSLETIQPDDDKVILATSSGFASAPIRSLEEIIDMANSNK